MPDYNFAPIALQPQQQTSLGDMLNIARSAQAYQQAQQINPLQQQKAALELEQAKSSLDLSRINAEKAKALLNPEIMQGIATSETAGNTATLKRMEVADVQAQKIANGQISLINNPLVIKAEKSPQSLTEDERSELVKLVQKNAKLQATNAGINDVKRVEELSRPYLETAIKTPEQLRSFAIDRHIAGLNSAAEIKSSLTPTGATVNSGREEYGVNLNPFAGKIGAVIPGTYTTKELPPTTQIVSPTGQPGYLGGGGGFVPSALPPNAAVGSETLPQIFSDAQNAQNRIGLLQNIKELAGKAFTGVGGSRKEFAAGLANAIGVPAYELEKGYTDVLAKNSALLSLTGGNTDAARALAEAANPNKKMNLEAIKEASNQLIATERLKQKKAEFLKPFVNDPITLQNKQLEFAKIADPRLLQEMTPEQVKSLKQSMTPDERKEFADKLAEARRLGLIK